MPDSFNLLIPSADPPCVRLPKLNGRRAICVKKLRPAILANWARGYASWPNPKGFDSPDTQRELLNKKNFPKKEVPD